MKKIMMVDGFSILFRCFYGMPLLTNRDGEYVNAVYGFLSAVFKLIDEEKPDYILTAFDTPKPTFRHEAYFEYKGSRKQMPDEMRPQVPLLKTMLAKMNIAVAECEGYEADDILGTLARRAEAAGMEPVIVSGDRDLLQTATNTVRVKIIKTKGGKTETHDYRAADVLNEYGVSPEALIDVKALMGDASDNIPGVPGIGEVTALKIIQTYKNLDEAIIHAKDIKPKKASENLAAFSDQAYLSKKLAAIVTDAPVETDLETAAAGNIFNADALAECARHGFKSFLPRFKQADTVRAETEVGSAKTLTTEAEVKSYTDYLLREKKPAGVYAIKDGKKYIGMAVSPAEGEPAVILPGGQDDLLTVADAFIDSTVTKIVFDAKSSGFICGSFFDALIAEYVLRADNPPRDVSDLAFRYLNETFPSIEDLLKNKGKKEKDRLSVSDLPFSVCAAHMHNAASALVRVYPIMQKELAEAGQTDLFEKIEMPLINVLRKMETAGIKIDRAALTEYGLRLDAHIVLLTDDIYGLAGGPFNIMSPAQLSVVLFEKLGLKGGKKTSLGYSTAADELEKLTDRHPIAQKIIEYRTYAKLKSTYVDGLLAVANGPDSKVFSTFHQVFTSTGRLSSSEPNLQNIPVRMPLGRELRKVFIPSSEDRVFISADYNQIELRLMAHMSGDETLIDAFVNNRDIHRLTASKVFHVPPEAVTKEMRGSAKAVNFGIIYGISAFGLSKDLNISVKEADRFINEFFYQFPKVKKYLEYSVETAKTAGYAATIYNRRRAIKELGSANAAVRAFGSRAAMNMPIQGSAADIIKIAMIKVSDRLEKEKLFSKIILQVHDELLLEVRKEERVAVRQILKDEMEGAANLSVPLSVEINEGASWFDA